MYGLVWHASIVVECGSHFLCLATDFFACEVCDLCSFCCSFGACCFVLVCCSPLTFVFVVCCICFLRLFFPRTFLSLSLSLSAMSFAFFFVIFFFFFSEHGVGGGSTVEALPFHHGSPQAFEPWTYRTYTQVRVGIHIRSPKVHTVRAFFIPKVFFWNLELWRGSGCRVKEPFPNIRIHVPTYLILIYGELQRRWRAYSAFPVLTREICVAGFSVRKTRLYAFQRDLVMIVVFVYGWDSFIQSCRESMYHYTKSNILMKN